MSRPPECPACRSRMEEGFVPDFSHGVTLQMLWHPGTPEDSRFLGLKTGSVKVDKSEAIRIAVFRCRKCGLLRSYALED